MTDTTFSGEIVRPDTTPAGSAVGASEAIAPVLVVYAALVAAILATIVLAQGWVQVYTLDDPYIHLSVARTVLAGGYGINPGEIQAPASSILWPFMLAPFGFLSDAAFALVPLVVNVALGAALCVQLASIAGAVTPEEHASRLVVGLLATGLMVALNVPGLVMTGMEHVLQVLVTAVIVRGVIRLEDEGQVDPRLPWVLALAPLVRYEMLAITGPVLVLLWIRGRRRLALTTGLGTAIPLAAFSAFLYANDLGLLPSSVVSKTPSAVDATLLDRVWERVSENMGEPLAVLLVVLATVLAISLFVPGLKRGFAVIAIAAVPAHLAFGRFDGMDRYAQYVALVVLAAVLHRCVHIARSQALRERLPGWLWPAVAGTAVGSLALVVAADLVLVPTAARNIHLQHYQMGRIAADLVDGPVAVNDLGLVSYLDPDWTVDLWGLAARDGLEARRDGPEAFRAWIEAESRSRGVVLAMIYDSWVGEARPPAWRLLARMTFDQPIVSAGAPTVSFYATAPDRAGDVRRALEGFATSAPPEVGFTLVEERPRGPRR